MIEISAIKHPAWDWSCPITNNIIKLIVFFKWCDERQCFMCPHRSFCQFPVRVHSWLDSGLPFTPSRLLVHSSLNMWHHWRTTSSLITFDQLTLLSLWWITIHFTFGRIVLWQCSFVIDLADNSTSIQFSTFTPQCQLYNCGIGLESLFPHICQICANERLFFLNCFCIFS